MGIHILLRGLIYIKTVPVALFCGAEWYAVRSSIFPWMKKNAYNYGEKSNRYFQYNGAII